MSDIFISYASEDLDRVRPLVDGLERLEKTKWSVFWDRTIPARKTWRQVIGAEIQSCRTVVVVWTEKSVDSEWVLGEAEIGKRRKVLVPVLLDKVEPPFGFGTIQAANLVAWREHIAEFQPLGGGYCCDPWSFACGPERSRRAQRFGGGSAAERARGTSSRTGTAAFEGGSMESERGSSKTRRAWFEANVVSTATRNGRKLTVFSFTLSVVGRG